MRAHRRLYGVPCRCGCELAAVRPAAECAGRGKLGLRGGSEQMCCTQAVRRLDPRALAVLAPRRSNTRFAQSSSRSARRIQLVFPHSTAMRSPGTFVPKSFDPCKSLMADTLSEHPASSRLALLCCVWRSTCRLRRENTRRASSASVHRDVPALCVLAGSVRMCPRHQ